MAKFKQKTRDLYTFSVKGRLNGETARSLNHFVCQHGSALKGKKLILDLYQVERVFPDGAVPIAAIASELQKHKVDIDIIQPRFRDAHNLLHRMLFYHYVSPDRFAPPRFTTSRFPIRSFTSYEDQDKVVTQIIDVCSRELQFSSGMPVAFEWAVNELAGNVIDHAQSYLGFAQVVSFSSNGNLNLVIADKGVGIFEALSAVHSTNERDAILLAMKEGVTGKPERNQGFGLHGASQIVKAARGRLSVSSGSRVYSQFMDRTSNRSIGTPYRGTIVEMELPMDVSIDLGEVIGQKDTFGFFDSQFQQDDGTLLIKLTSVASNFGNRGTGHRVRNIIINAVHSSNGRKVAISFQGVHVIASSFADEAFAKLAYEMGQQNFMATVQLSDMSQLVKAIMRRVFQKRLGDASLLDD